MYLILIILLAIIFIMVVSSFSTDEGCVIGIATSILFFAISMRILTLCNYKIAHYVHLNKEVVFDGKIDSMDSIYVHLVKLDTIVNKTQIEYR